MQANEAYRAPPAALVVPLAGALYAEGAVADESPDQDWIPNEATLRSLVAELGINKLETAPARQVEVLESVRSAQRRDAQRG